MDPPQKISVHIDIKMQAPTQRKPGFKENGNNEVSGDPCVVFYPLN